MAECDMGARSNFADILDPPLHDATEAGAEAVRAHRRIRGWLTEVGDHDAGVLAVAYAAGPWPLTLREELGRVTGVVVRLAAAEVGLPDDDAQLEALERKTAERLTEALTRRGGEGLERFRKKGLLLLGKAFASYVRERGGRDSPLLTGIS
jgi:hypothetical protein